MNTDFLFLVSLLIILSNIYLLGTSRLGAMIRAIGAQGMLLSVLPLLLLTQQTTMEIFHIILLSTLSIIVKGYMIPNYLEKVIHTVKVKRELNPYVGYISSVLFGLIVSYASFALLRHMPFYALVVSPIHAATAMASILIGTFLIASRKNVLAQIIGFLVFENAGFILGISIATTQPLFIEIAILFDLVAGVIIMGATMRFIHTHFDSISVNTLERLSK
jgi:hydrogenase-4 component E